MKTNGYTNIYNATIGFMQSIVKNDDNARSRLDQTIVDRQNKKEKDKRLVKYSILSTVITFILLCLLFPPVHTEDTILIVLDYGFRAIGSLIPPVLISFFATPMHPIYSILDSWYESVEKKELNDFIKNLEDNFKRDDITQKFKDYVDRIEKEGKPVRRVELIAIQSIALDKVSFVGAVTKVKGYERIDPLIVREIPPKKS